MLPPPCKIATQFIDILGQNEILLALDHVTGAYFFLRALLVNRPDMMVPTFFAQYQFVCNIKSTYQVDMPGTKNFDVGANTVPWGVISVLGPRQK